MSVASYEFVEDSTTIAPTSSSPSVRGESVCEQCSSSSPDIPTTIPRFLLYVLGVAFRQTAHILIQNLKSTWMLVCALPRPFFDSVRLITSVWLHIFRVLYILLLALLLCLFIDTYNLIHKLFARLQRLWNEIDVLRVLRHLFPFSAAAAQVSASPSQSVCHRSTSESPSHPTTSAAQRSTWATPIRVS